MNTEEDKDSRARKERKNDSTYFFSAEVCLAMGREKGGSKGVRASSCETRQCSLYLYVQNVAHQASETAHISLKVVCLLSGIKA